MTGTKDMVLASSGPVDETHPCSHSKPNTYQTYAYHSLREPDTGTNKKTNETNTALLEFLAEVSPTT